MNSLFTVCLNLVIETIVHYMVVMNLHNTQCTNGIIVGMLHFKNPVKS